MKTIKWNVCLLLLGLALGACGSKGGGGSSDTNTNKETKSAVYYLSDGVCFRQTNNSKVSDSNCKDFTFGLQGGACFNLKTQKEVSLSNCTGNRFFEGSRGCFDRSGDIVSNALCDGEGNNDGGTSTGKRCEGNHYILYDLEGAIRVNCHSGNNYCGCSGRNNCESPMLLDERTNDFIICP